ncbi:MAG: hypothetical protein AAGH83_06740 [Pseudomonadota bacterium]
MIGAIWASNESYMRVFVTKDGEITTSPNTGHYIQVLEKHGPLYAIKLSWWNPNTSSAVEDYGTMAKIDDNLYAYREANDPDQIAADIVGAGFIRVIDDDTIEWTLLGTLTNASAAVAQNQLTRVDAVPDLSAGR